MWTPSQLEDAHVRRVVAIIEEALATLGPRCAREPVNVSFQFDVDPAVTARVDEILVMYGWGPGEWSVRGPNLGWRWVKFSAKQKLRE